MGIDEASDTVRVYVGTDRSQLLAVKVLEHSIKRHTELRVEVYPMLDLPIRNPKDPRQGQRTGFSFSRFCIPALAGYRGRAIYMDADMLVLKDISELWNIPFNGAKVIIQEELSSEQASTIGKTGAPSKRIKQSAVMLLDCSKLDWKIENIIDGLDRGDFDYAELMYDMCLLHDSEIRYGIPFRWNSLEHLDRDTALIHYTDMHTQPWASPFNANSEIWFDEVNLMLADGSLTESEIKNEIALGFFRPSLLRDLKWRKLVPSFLRNAWATMNEANDRARGYKKHAAVYAAKKAREAAVKVYEASLR